MDYFKQQRELMVFLQLKSRDIKDKKVLDAFLRVPRENFVIPEYRYYAYEDRALPTLNNQTISQPYIVALMTQLLEVEESDVALEIGTGSGYQSAILSRLCERVVSYEIDEEICEFAIKNLKDSKFENVEVVCGDATKSIKYKNFFDRCVITAATRDIPKTVLEALKEGGILVVPQGESYANQILKKYKKVNGELKLLEESISVVFVPLTGEEGFD